MKEKLSFKTKLFYGFGDTGLSISYTITGLLLLFFLTDVAGLDPFLAGAVLLIGKIWDAITDPLTGYMSDKTRTKIGRRKPYIALSSIPFGLTFMILWITPQHFSGLQLFFLYAALFSLHITFFTLYAVPYQSLTAELTEDYNERTSLTSFRMFFSIVGGLISAIIPMMIINSFNNQKTGFAVMGILTGIFLIVPPIAVFFNIKEKFKDTKKPDTNIFVSIKETLSNKPYQKALLMYLFTWMGIDLISAVFVYYVKYVLLMEEKTYIFLGLLFITAIIFLPFWYKVSEFFGKKKAYVYGTSFLIVVLLTIAIVLKPPIFLIYLLIFLAGIGISSSHIIPSSIIPDVVEYDELKSGFRREGMFYGFSTFFQKLASSFAIFLAGLILKIAGYVPNTLQSQSSLFAIRFLMGGLSGLIFLAGIISLSLYPITKEYHETIREELKKRRQNLSEEV